jgi:hypothetical protein
MLVHIDPAWDNVDERVNAYVEHLDAEIKSASGEAHIELEAEYHGDQDGDKGQQSLLLEKIKAASSVNSFSNQEAATVFQVSVHTIRNWIDEGKLKKAPKRGRVTSDSIKARLDIP